MQESGGVQGRTYAAFEERARDFHQIEASARIFKREIALGENLSCC